jgi:hypothetical protein
MGDSFHKYKKEVMLLREAVERHFSKVISQIEAGLPDVIEHEADKDDVFQANSTTWICPTCTTTNLNTQE